MEQRLAEEAVNLTAPEVSDSGSEELQESQQNTSTGAASQDEIPSFSEWAKKHMAEAGRNKGDQSPDF